MTLEKELERCIYCLTTIPEGSGILIQLRPERQVAHILCWKNEKHRLRMQKLLINRKLQKPQTIKLSDQMREVWDKLAFPNQEPLNVDDHNTISRAIEKLKMIEKEERRA